jgi:hypothetical protein
MVLVDPLFAPGDLGEAKGARCPMRNTFLVGAVSSDGGFGGLHFRSAVGQ